MMTTETAIISPKTVKGSSGFRTLPGTSTLSENAPAQSNANQSKANGFLRRCTLTKENLKTQYPNSDDRKIKDGSIAARPRPCKISAQLDEVGGVGLAKHAFVVSKRVLQREDMIWIICVELDTLVVRVSIHLARHQYKWQHRRHPSQSPSQNH